MNRNLIFIIISYYVMIRAHPSGNNVCRVPLPVNFLPLQEIEINSGNVIGILILPLRVVPSGTVIGTENDSV